MSNNLYPKKTTEHRSWKSYVKIWIGFLIVGLILYIDNDFAINRSIMIQLTFLFSFWNGIVLLLDLLMETILKKRPIIEYFKSINLPPFCIDLFLIIMSLGYLWTEYLRFFYFVLAGTLGISFVIIIFLVLLNKIRA